ncbi:MAG: hypothetical protein K1X67_25975 [Fimbriimonadaceae bacterium]|nr:hypothetical protein [Fimbriimonadaceae bacterium]
MVSLLDLKDAAEALGFSCEITTVLTVDLDGRIFALFTIKAGIVETNLVDETGTSFDFTGSMKWDSRLSAQQIMDCVRSFPAGYGWQERLSSYLQALDGNAPGSAEAAGV